MRSANAATAVRALASRKIEGVDLTNRTVSTSSATSEARRTSTSSAKPPRTAGVRLYIAVVTYPLPEVASASGGSQSPPARKRPLVVGEVGGLETMAASLTCERASAAPPKLHCARSASCAVRRCFAPRERVAEMSVAITLTKSYRWQRRAIARTRLPLSDHARLRLARARVRARAPVTSTSSPGGIRTRSYTVRVRWRNGVRPTAYGNGRHRRGDGATRRARRMRCLRTCGGARARRRSRGARRPCRGLARASRSPPSRAWRALRQRSATRKPHRRPPLSGCYSQPRTHCSSYWRGSTLDQLRQVPLVHHPASSCSVI